MQGDQRGLHFALVAAWQARDAQPRAAAHPSWLEGRAPACRGARCMISSTQSGCAAVRRRERALTCCVALSTSSGHWLEGRAPACCAPVPSAPSWSSWSICTWRNRAGHFVRRSSRMGSTIPTALQTRPHNKSVTWHCGHLLVNARQQVAQAAARRAAAARACQRGLPLLMQFDGVARFQVWRGRIVRLAPPKPVAVACAPRSAVARIC